MSRECHLIAKLDDEGRVIAVATCGEPPWEMTRMDRSEWVLVMTASDDSFGSALEQLEQSYPKYMPKLAARFPFPKR